MVIDRFLPNYDVSAAYDLFIPAPPERVYLALKGADFSGSVITMILLGLRSLPSWIRLRQKPVRRRVTLASVSESGFMMLADTPQEVVMGVAGQFWKLSGNVNTALKKEQFETFSEPGYAKAVWNFSIRSDDGGSRLATETRIRCTDDTSRRKFLRYWRFVGPFSGVIRREMLRLVHDQV